MEAIYKTQAAFKRELGLSKVKVIHNKNYKRHGTKSYVYLLNRFGFQPTLPGPYHYINKIEQRGLSHPEFAGHRVGGRVHTHKTLVKKAHAHHYAHHGSSDVAAGSGTGSTQSGQVTAEDQQNDSEYLCEVSIGTPAQTFMLDFDTGSSDLWVFSTELSASLQKGHNVFNPAKSSTWKANKNMTWQISYGDGSSASGDCGTDNVTIGGLTIKNQVVEEAKQLAAQFAQGTGDGLLGLAWTSINTVQTNGQSTPQNTPVTNMIAQEDIPQDAELFTSAFYSDRDSGSPQSFYTFGWIDQDLVTASGAEIAWTDIDNSQGFWQFSSGSSVINGQTITQNGNTAIADTGTTLALVSDQVCEALYKAIPGATYDQNQQGYVFPTSVTVDQLPTFSVAVGDTQFTIQKEDLCFAPADGNTWYGGVQSRGTMTFDILGDTFLKSVYAIWDQGNTRWGTVPKLQSTQNITPPTSSS